jgi:YD repeat-containing protein
MDVYTFAASANDGVTIRARKTSGTLSVYLELYGPTGARITTSSSGKIDRVLTTAGPYKIIVRDSSYVNTGDYLLYWERMNIPCGGTATTCGQVVTGSIGTAVDPPPWRSYSFSASANDIVTIRVTKTSGTFTPYLELYGPAGTLLGSAAGRMDKTLIVAGTHTIIVRDQNNLNAGNYLLTWLRVNNPCNGTPIGCGQVLAGTVSIVSGIYGYTLTAKGGDNIVLTLTKTSGGFDPFLELYNSSGTRVAYQYTSSGSQVTLTQTLSTGGTYTVFVSDYGNNETGGYTLSFQKNNNFCAEVVVITPNGGEKIGAGSNFTISWSCASCEGVNSQEIRLSPDGGLSFPNVIATGLTGSARSFPWNVPTNIITNDCRIRVTATNASGMSTLDDSDSNFEIYQVLSRSYVYDELNRLIQVIYEDGRKVTYTYDTTGNRITLTNE